VILSDMRMPDIDGRSIFRYVRENRPELERRLVFATGDVANPDAIEFMQVCGRPILEKPFSIRVLHETVERVAGRA
jgi:two-component system NtrC family sensor kinase